MMASARSILGTVLESNIFGNFERRTSFLIIWVGDEFDLQSTFANHLVSTFVCICEDTLLIPN